ncbi:MAG: signal protein [Betaproteobacteria bacterium]|nr:signal protein [Betaproteobacteria bacterium]
MKTLLQSFVFGTSLVIAAHAFAQAPAAPAKPMTAAPPAVVAAPAPPAAPMAPATATPPAKKKAFQTPATAAPGGGADKVWVNSGSKVYHCPGGKYYGKTKAGSYMSEADAKAAGNHAVSKKGCF